MSAPHRCARCGHRPGPRGLNIAKANPKRVPDSVGKKPCDCGCHVFGGPGLHVSTAPPTEAEMRRAQAFAAEHGFLTEVSS